MATNIVSRMMRNVHPFQIKDPVTNVRVLARFLPPHDEIEGRLAAWEIVDMPAVEHESSREAA
jgi:hypothetical protein